MLARETEELAREWLAQMVVGMPFVKLALYYGVVSYPVSPY